MRWMGREEEGENERSDLWTATMKCCSRWSQNQLGRHIARRPGEWARGGEEDKWSKPSDKGPKTYVIGKLTSAPPPVI